MHTHNQEFKKAWEFEVSKSIIQNEMTKIVLYSDKNKSQCKEEQQIATI